MNAIVRILTLAAILLSGCGATQDVAASSYHVTRGAAVALTKWLGLSRSVRIVLPRSGALCDAEEGRSIIDDGWNGDSVRCYESRPINSARDSVSLATATAS